MIDVQDLDVINIINEKAVVIQTVIDFPKTNNNLIVYSESCKNKNYKKPIIIEPNTESISPIIKYCIETLKNSSPEEQSKCIDIISKGVKNPQTAPQFLDAGITDSLFMVINSDTSKMKKPSLKQKRLRNKIAKGYKLSDTEYKIASKLSERELAEQNNNSAFEVIGQLQNILYDEMIKRSDLKPALTDMPAYARLYDLSKNAVDENIKISALKTLYMMYRNEYREDFINLFEQFTTSKNPQIKNFAQNVLENLKNK